MILTRGMGQETFFQHGTYRCDALGLDPWIRRPHSHLVTCPTRLLEQKPGRGSSSKENHRHVQEQPTARLE